MKQNTEFLKKAESLRPRIYTLRIAPKQIAAFEMDASGNCVPVSSRPFEETALGRGEKICLDFGSHLVGHVTLELGSVGSHPDAPAWIRLKFAERPCELFEDAEKYSGWISTGWIQQEQLHIDVLPCTRTLERRYAFRYLEIDVLDVSSKYRLLVKSAECEAVSSADSSTLTEYVGPHQDLDAIACRTLYSCMQDVFEDGPKRDRRLWIGDLRIQALANYATFRQNDLVRRCLYLFAGSTLPDGQVAACVFTEPEVEADDTVMFDYSLLFIQTLLDYVRETNDLETARDLWPTALRQIEVVQPRFDAGGLVHDSDVLGWCFLDWNLALNKQAGAQGVYLLCASAAIELADLLGDSENHARLTADYEKKKRAAGRLWDAEQSVFVSGADRQISWASQVWMVLGGAVSPEEGAALLRRTRQMDHVEKMVTPYMMHNLIDALLRTGLRSEAMEAMARYWGGMANAGADTFWEMYNPDDPNESPYGGTIVNSYCHAWSCGPAYFLRRRFCESAGK